MNILSRFFHVFTDSTAQLMKNLGGTLMTVAAIGITLALPSLLYLAIDNVETLTGHWDGQAEVNLFLKEDTQPQELLQKLGAKPEVEKIDVIDPEQAFNEFKQHSGFEDAVTLLDANPLPWTVVVRLRSEYSDPERVDSFIQYASRLPTVDTVRSDLLWLKRLIAMVAIAERLVWILSILLGIAAVIIISNTIRLAVLNRREEIEVIKLVGGTDRFIRRPFIHQGLLQGALGSMVAVLLVTSCVELLREPVVNLFDEYGMNFSTHGLGWQSAGVLLLVGSLLGWAASRWSVSRHLADIEPE